jgi:hypothetical protein
MREGGGIVRGKFPKPVEEEWGSLRMRFPIVLLFLSAHQKMLV